MPPSLPDPRPYFVELPDPRRETRNKLHKLEDILMITLCATLSGVEDWTVRRAVGMEVFAKEKEGWLRSFLDLLNGIPSHDTLSAVIGRLDRRAFGEAFLAWSQAALPRPGGEPVCLDGKTVRGSRDGDTPAVHLPRGGPLSAFAGQARWVLAQRAVGEKANEITAIPQLLALLDITGAVVTTVRRAVDAMSCQKVIARAISEAGADYVLALKDNHPTLHEDVQLWLDSEIARGRLAVAETVEKDHGRIEVRRYALSTDLDWLEDRPQWAGLHALGRVESTRIIGEKTTTEYRYYLCSLTDTRRFAEAVRTHWQIENGQHWVLDVQFGEDACRTRKDHSVENLALIRRTALNLLRHNGPRRDSLKQRKLRAALSDDYRARLIQGIRDSDAIGST